MPMNIAIVDDNLTNLMIIEKIMKQAGYHKLELLSSARELYQFLQLDTSSPVEVPVDLILMDVMMPEVDGIRTLPNHSLPRSDMRTFRLFLSRQWEIPIRWPRRWMRVHLIMS